MQRFGEGASPPARHVTLVQAGGLTARTSWNPVWRRDDMAFDVALIGLAGVLALFSAWSDNRKRSLS